MRRPHHVPRHRVRRLALAVQVVATVALVVACVVGVVRLLVHAQTSTVGTAVNVTWVAYDLLVMSVIYQAAWHRAPVQTEETS